MTEDNEVSFAGDRDGGNTQKKPEYVRTIYLDVVNIDKNDKNAWRTIYKAIDAPFFGDFKLFPKSFPNQYRKHLNEPKKNPTDIKKNI